MITTPRPPDHNESEFTVAQVGTIEPEIISFNWTTKEAERFPMPGLQACWFLNDAIKFARGVEAVTNILMAHELRREDNPLVDVDQWEGLVLMLILFSASRYGIRYRIRIVAN